MKQLCARIVEARWFERFIISLIVLNGILLGLETSVWFRTEYDALILWSNRFIVAIFVLEAMIKIMAVAPVYGRYFKNGWNLFDFTIVVLSLIPASGELATLARLARLLRVLRLISVVPELRLIVATLIKSLPSMANIILLMSLIFYVYAVAGYHLYYQHDPQHWGTLGLSMLTLFRIVTLEDWTDVMYTAMELYPMSWIYFVSFVVIGTFVIINLFIAVVINNLDEAKTERLKEMQHAPGRDELMEELRKTQTNLQNLQEKLQKYDIHN